MARPYSTLTDWKKICPEETIRRLTVDSGTGAIDQTKVDECIAAADGELEPYLEAAGYTVPLVTVDALTRNISSVIGVYNAHLRKVADVPENWRNAYKDKINMLKDIRDGKMKLPATAPEADTGFACGAVITSHF
jgi:phage gp36-like protein